MTCVMLIAAAIYVIKIQTQRGELIVQSDYAGITVKVKRDGKEVNKGWSLLRGEDNKQLIRTGQIEIELPAELTGEYIVTPNRVTLTKEHQEVVRIERKQKPVARLQRPAPQDAHPTALANVPRPSDPANSIDRDRTAAQAWVDEGNTCTIVLKNSGKKVLISANGRLPSAPFEVRAVSASNPGTTSRHLEPLAGLTGLQRVSVERFTIDGQSIVSLGQIPNLRSIKFVNSEIWTSEFTDLSRLSFLHELAIDDSQVDDQWEFLRHLPNLRSLEIANYAAPSIADFQKWSEFPQLRALHLDGLVTPEMAATLHERNPLCRIVAWSPDKQLAGPVIGTGTRSFQVVGIDPVRIGAKAILPLGFRCSTNEHWNADSELALPYVRDLRNHDPFIITTVLVPRQVQFTEQALSGLGKFHFTRLDATGLEQADTFTKYLPTQLAVNEITFSSSDLTDEGLQQLQHVSTFPVLNVQGTHVTRAGIEEFKKVRPACQLVSNFTPPSTVAIPEEIPPAPLQTAVPADRERAAAELWQQRLGSGELMYVGQPDTVPFDPFTKLPDRPFYLCFARADSLQEVTNSDLELLTNLADFKSLRPRSDKLDVGAIPYIKRMPTLIGLDLSWSRIPSSAVAELRELPHLSNLGISGEMIDDEWAFMHQLKSPYRLGIANYQPTAVDWQRLQEISHLRVLHFHNDIDVNLVALAELQRRNPLCQVLVGYPKMRSVGVDPMREAVRKLTGHNIGFQIRVAPTVSQGSTVQEVLDNPSPFYVNILEIRLPKDHSPLNAELLSPLRAITYDELMFRSVGASADDFVAALPEDLRGQCLNFADTDLTDQGLLRLSRISRPIRLIVYNTKVTRAGIDAYRKADPYCRIWNSL